MHLPEVKGLKPPQAEAMVRLTKLPAFKALAKAVQNNPVRGNHKMCLRTNKRLKFSPYIHISVGWANVSASCFQVCLSCTDLSSTCLVRLHPFNKKYFNTCHLFKYIYIYIYGMLYIYIYGMSYIYIYIYIYIYRHIYIYIYMTCHTSYGLC